MVKKVRSLSDLTPDMRNANAGTERGRYMIETSLRETGAGRSIVVDKDDKIIAGNKTFEAWGEIGDPEAVQIIESDGTKLIVVKRTDLDLNDPTGRARQLAYMDNRTSEVGLHWDFNVLREDKARGVDLNKFFSPLELKQIEILAFKAEEDKEPEDVEDFPDVLPNLRILDPEPAFPSDQPFGIPEFIPEMIPEIPHSLKTWAGQDSTPMEDHDGFWLYNFGSDSIRGLDLEKTILSFWVDDPRFERWWALPDFYTIKAINAGFMCMVAPDFSLWDSAPRAVHVYNTFRSRWLGRYFQEAGLPTIPNLEWATDDDFTYTLAGIPKGANAVARQVQTIGGTKEEINKNLENFEYALDYLRPKSLLLYGGGESTRKELLKILPSDLRVVWIESRASERIGVMSSHMKQAKEA